MKTAANVARMLLGLLFFVFGVNFFFPLFSMPPHSGEAGNLIGAMYSSGYLLHAAKGIEIVAGALLLSGVLVPLALVLLGPIVVNIGLFHLFLTQPDQWAMPALVVALEVFLIWAYRDYFRGLFVAKAVPGEAAELGVHRLETPQLAQ